MWRLAVECARKGGSFVTQVRLHTAFYTTHLHVYSQLSFFLLACSGALQYKIVGGVLDFFVFLGPTPANVIAQYTELVGYPRLPPLWSLGFHQCRWGYKTVNFTRLVVENYTSNQLPVRVGFCRPCILLWSHILNMDF